MTAMTWADIDAWDTEAITQMSTNASATSKNSVHTAAQLTAIVNGVHWNGTAADAARESNSKITADMQIDAARWHLLSLALTAAAVTIADVKSKKAACEKTATEQGLTIDPTTGKVSAAAGQTDAQRASSAKNIEALQTSVNTTLAEAQAADNELATGIDAAAGIMTLTDAQAALQKDGVTDQSALPVPTESGVPASPTEATRDNTTNPSGTYLADNPAPSPLLSGLSAATWRQRLANFKPGDPLPDPRTPTGDPAIDAIAFAAGQQNATYAWGGNKSTQGPSQGINDGPGGDATKYDDQHRVGYDCAGLMHFAITQATGTDPFGPAQDTQGHWRPAPTASRREACCSPSKTVVA